ncbi:glycosyltransferase [Cohnella cholangitidis]|uniref:Glycosyltransferase n=1 Tax=Cohnella cholangitidis TaxID=2598458 RepID=A0A7G5BYB0_9BACL|nr:glycosyltransferase [Cohnella cholangitidis]QMV41944.1 glycosyltransferase [Cohnella cholangitidis]
MLNRLTVPHAKTAVRRESEALENALRQIDHLIEDQLGAAEGYKQRIEELRIEENAHEATMLRLREEIAKQESKLAEADLLFYPNYENLLQYYKQFVEGPLTEEAKQIVELMRVGDFRGIIVYPDALHWESLQRPQQLMIEFARKDYLCFFCDSGDQFELKKIEKGLFVVSKQEHLLQALQTSHVLVLNSYLIQNAWIDNLPHKSLWYDVLDRVDNFDQYDRHMLAKHYQVLHEADIVTYSAKQLMEYVEDRNDAIYLPCAARSDEFRYESNSIPTVPRDLEPILKKNKKIIGYFGAIDEGFDIKLVSGLASGSEVEIVLVGHCSISRESFLDNVYLLEPESNSRLKEYIAYFDALLIPFITNPVTNADSIVKLFEYCAIGKPILAAPSAEVVPFAGPGITFVDPGDSFRPTASFWEVTTQAKTHLQSIARNHQWSNRADEIEKELESRPFYLKVLANRSIDPHVSVFTATFFDFDGTNYYTGGAERYLVDLHEICRDLGLRLDIYQYGNYSWYRKYKDIDVYSLGHEELNMREFSMDNVVAFNRRYLYAAEGKSALNFYSAFFQAYPSAAHPSIGISHGVAWDNSACSHANGEQFWNHNERFIQGAEQVQKMVSVDTNTANWFQTVSYHASQRMETIPNYVDPNEFFPIPKRNDGKIRIVYPRRLYEARGLYITLAVADSILANYSQVEFHFVGKGFEEDVNQVKKAMKRWPDRIFCYHREPDDMHLVYKEADIVLIPTLYSEGTSLSCLEACATGNTVIATRVGGLTDIIIDRFNGLLISPNSKSLKEAIIECLDNPELSQRLGKNAYEVSKSFNKTYWKERWKGVIRDVLSSRSMGQRNAGSLRRDIEFCLGSNARQEDWMPVAVSCLKKGMAVFIRGDDSQKPESSFGRLQWVSKEAELYFQPEKICFD